MDPPLHDPHRGNTATAVHHRLEKDLSADSRAYPSGARHTVMRGAFAKIEPSVALTVYGGVNVIRAVFTHRRLLASFEDYSPLQTLTAFVHGSVWRRQKTQRSSGSAATYTQRHVLCHVMALARTCHTSCQTGTCSHSCSDDGPHHSTADLPPRVEYLELANFRPRYRVLPGSFANHKGIETRRRHGRSPPAKPVPFGYFNLCPGRNPLDYLPVAGQKQTARKQ